MPPKSAPHSEKRPPSARRRSIKVLEIEDPKFAGEKGPIDQSDQPEQPDAEPYSPEPSVDEVACETTKERTLPTDSDVTLPVLKQEKSEDGSRAKVRGKNWTEKEIPILIQAGLGTNLDARNGSDNRLRYEFQNESTLHMIYDKQTPMQCTSRKNSCVLHKAPRRTGSARSPTHG
jgi:hypothetical protein